MSFATPPPHVTALFVRSDSIYKTLPGVDAWDIERDALRWPGGTPVVAHPARLRKVACRIGTPLLSREEAPVMTPQQTCDQCNAFIEALAACARRLPSGRAMSLHEVSQMKATLMSLEMEARCFKLHATVHSVTEHAPPVRTVPAFPDRAVLPPPASFQERIPA